MNVRVRIGYWSRLVAALMLGVGLAASAGASNREVTEAEIRAFMESYLETFNRGYSRQVVGHYDAPLFMMAPNGDVRSYDTERSIRMTVRDWKRQLIRSGFDHSEWEVLNVRSLGDGAGLASAVFKRLTGSGDVIQRGAATYTVHKKDGDWKIFLIQIHDPDDVIEF